MQRYLTFYRNNFGFSKPFRVLMDGTFCLAALENKVNLREQLRKYLNEELLLLTSACVLRELEILGDSFYGALHIAKQFRIEECGHPTPIPPDRCLKALVKKNNKYFVGTQDRELTEYLRSVPGCPVLFVK